MYAAKAVFRNVRRVKKGEIRPWEFTLSKLIFLHDTCYLLGQMDEGGGQKARGEEPL